MLSMTSYLIFRTFTTILILIVLFGTLNYYKKRNDIKIINSDKVEVDVVSYKDLPYFTGFPALITYFVILIFILFGIDVIFVESKYTILTKKWIVVGTVIFGGTIFPLILEFWNGLLSDEVLFNGYLVAELLPGIKYNITSYVGTSYYGILAGILSFIVSITPAILFIFASMKSMDFIKNRPKFKLFVDGIGSAVNGFLLMTVALLWYYSCIKNTYYNLFLGTLNSVSITIIVKMFKLSPLCSLVFCPTISVIICYIKLNI